MKRCYLILTNDKFSFVNADNPWITWGSEVWGSINTTVGLSYKRECIYQASFSGSATSVSSSLKNTVCITINYMKCHHCSFTASLPPPGANLHKHAAQHLSKRRDIIYCRKHKCSNEREYQEISPGRRVWIWWDNLERPSKFLIREIL